MFARGADVNCCSNAQLSRQGPGKGGNFSHDFGPVTTKACKVRKTVKTFQENDARERGHEWRLWTLTFLFCFFG